MGDRNSRKSGKKLSKKEGNNFSVLDGELNCDAAASAGPANLSDPVIGAASGDLSSPPSTDALAEYLKAATANFERMMEKAMKSMIESIQKVEKALEFEGVRINDLEKKNKELEERLVNMEKAFGDLQQRIGNHDMEANKAERSARKNNFRIVGIEEPKENQVEDCIKKVESIISTKFNQNMKVERAHRDGKKGDKARHIVVKTLSYREKIHLMKNAREQLKGESFYFTDDLTKADLTEKKRHVKKVQELYQKGTKLRFYAGLWRGTGGVPYFTT